MHYTALWVLNSDPSTGRDTWSSMTQLWSDARDVIHVHPLGSTQHTAVPGEPRACLGPMGPAGSATQLAVAGTTLSMQTWRLKIPGVASLLGF